MSLQTNTNSKVSTSVIGATSYSGVAWIKVIAWPTSLSPVGGMGGATYISVQPNGLQVSQTIQGTGSYSSPMQAMALNQWYLVGTTYNQATGRIKHYLNGGVILNQVVGGPSVGADWAIAAAGIPGTGSEGSMVTRHFWNASWTNIVLTDQDMIDMAAMTKTPLTVTPSATRFSPLNETSGTVEDSDVALHDAVGSVDMTVTGPAWATLEWNADTPTGETPPPPPVVAGTISGIWSTNETRLRAVEATGGTPPFTHQWHRSTVSNFTPDGSTVISGATALSIVDSGLTQNTQYYYKIVYTDSLTQTGTSAQFAVKTATTSGTLSPGNLWTGTLGTGGPTPTQPPRVKFYPIAHFDRPDYERIIVAENPNIKLGVLAFAKGDIASVVFVCEGNSVKITNRTFNNESGVWGFVVNIDLSEVEHEGAVTVSAIIYPADIEATPRVLTGWEIWVDDGTRAVVKNNPATDIYYINSDSGDNNTGNGTSGNPFQTIAGAATAVAALKGNLNFSGCTFRLQDSAAGYRYDIMDVPGIGGEQSGYLIIESADTNNKAVFNQGSGLYGYGALRVRDVVVDFSGSAAQGTAMFGGEGSSARYRLWIENCNYTCVNGTQTTGLSGSWQKRFITGVIAQDIGGAFSGLDFVKDCTGSNLNGDVFTATSCVINTHVSDANQIGEQHLDMDQIEVAGLGSGEAFSVNALRYNVSCGWNGAGIFYVRAPDNNWIADIAHVNGFYRRIGGNSSGINAPIEHILFYNCTFANDAISFGDHLSYESMPITGGSGEMTRNVTITGGTSGATATMGHTQSATADTLYFSNRVGTFLEGETITNSASGATCICDGPSTYIGTQGFNEVRGCAFSIGTPDPTTNAAFIESNIEFDSNNYSSGSWTPGTNATTIANPFIDVGTVNYNPTSEMPVMPRLGQVLDDNQTVVRGTATKIGAFEQPQASGTPMVGMPMGSGLNLITDD
jgi:hypothetical protein